MSKRSRVNLFNIQNTHTFNYFSFSTILSNFRQNFCFKIELFSLVLVHCVRLSCPVNLVKTDRTPDRTKKACPGTGPDPDRTVRSFTDGSMSALTSQDRGLLLREVHSRPLRLMTFQSEPYCPKLELKCFKCRDRLEIAMSP